MKTLIEVLEALYRIYRKSLKGLLILFFGVTFIACEGGGSGSSAIAAPDQSPGGSPISVTRKSGRDFSCVMFELSGGSRVFCRAEGAGLDARLGIVSASYSLYIASAVPLSAFETWDDTICISASVADRPYDNTPGLATWCLGDASLGFNYMSYPILYGAPYVNDPTTHPGEISFAEVPFSGGNHSMDVMTDTGGTWLVMMDSASEVTEETLSCENQAGDLVCADFTLVGAL